MLKLVTYSLLTVVGVLAALRSPLAGAVAVIESYFLHPVPISPTLASYRPQFWISLAFILGFILHRDRTPQPAGRETIVIWALGMYGAVALASSAWAVARPEVSFEKSFDICKTILVTIMIFKVLTSERAVMIVTWACLIGAAHAAFMHTVGANLEYVPYRFSREDGVISDYQGSVMVFFMPMFLLFAVYSNGWKERTFCWLSMPLVLDSIINTYQRACFLALLGQALMLTVALPKRVVLKLAPVGAVAAILLLGFFTPDTYWEWMGTVRTYQQESSASSRIDIAKASVEMLQDYPLGVGYYNYMWVSPQYLDPRWLTPNDSGELVRSPHNAFFDVACNTGILGAMLFAVAVGGSWWMLRKIRKGVVNQRPTQLQVVAMGLEMGLVGWAIAGVFHSTHEDEPMFWTVALAAALWRVGRNAVACPKTRRRLISIYDNRGIILDRQRMIAELPK